MDKCHKIIEDAEKKQTNPVPSWDCTNLNSMNSFKSQKGKNVFSSEETFNDISVLQAIDRDIEENQKRSFQTKQKSSESLFGRSCSDKQKKNGNDGSPKQEVLELDDSFDEEIARLEPENEVTVIKKKQTEIKVLQNITVQPKRCATDSDDEIFSDTDVVETTPPINAHDRVLDNK